MRAWIAAWVLAMSFGLVSQPLESHPLANQEGKEAARTDRSPTDYKAVATVATSSPVPPSLTQEELEKKRAEEPKQFFGYVISADWAVAFSTIALGIFTLFLWLTTRSMARDANRSAKAAEANSEFALKAAEKAAITQARAYVGPDGREIISGLHRPGALCAKIEIKNFGQTPAHDVEIVCRLFVRDWTPPWTDTFSPTDEAIEHMSRAVLHPGEMNPTFVTRNDETGLDCLTDEERALILEKDGPKAIYVLGKILYKDAFGNSRETGFYYMIGGPHPISGNSLAVCRTGNYAT